MHDLTPDEYEQIWTDGAEERVAMRRLRNYYDGIHAIVGQNEVYTDGSTKSEIVSNFIKPAIDLYVGTMSDPYNVTALELETPEGDEEVVNEGPELYREIGTNNDFDTTDVTVRRDAYLYGWGIETDEFIDNKIVITARDPIAWRRVYNSDGTLIGLVNMSKVPKGGFSGDTMQTEDLNIMVVITDKAFKTFHMQKDVENGNWFTPEGFPDREHNYGAVPATIYQVNETMTTHITEDVIGLQDEYNEIDSASGDNVKSEADGLLALEGFSPKDVSDNAEVIREMRVIGVPVGGGVSYVSKNTDTLRIESRLKRTRDSLFLSLAVPDINDIVGATGSTSGIALQLKFKPMVDNAKAHIAWLRSGVRDRIDLINAVTSKSSDKAIEDVQVNINFSLPRNTVEEWQNIGNLTGIVSHRKQLEMLTDVNDPAQEESRLVQEADDERDNFRQTGTPEEIIARNDAEINEASISLQPQIASMIQAIADAARKQITDTP